MEGTGPDWHVVAATLDGRAFLLGEIKWTGRPVNEGELDRIGRILLAKGLPQEQWASAAQIIHAVLVPEVLRPPRPGSSRRPFLMITARDVIGSLQ